MPVCMSLQKFLPSAFTRKTNPTPPPATKEVSRPSNEKPMKTISPRPATPVSNTTASSLRARAREFRNSTGFAVPNGRRTSRSSLRNEARKAKPVFEDHGVYIMLYASQRQGEAHANAMLQERRFSNASSVYEEDMIAEAAAAAKARGELYEWGIYVPLQTGERQRTRRSHEQGKRESTRRRSSLSSFLDSFRGKEKTSKLKTENSPLTPTNPKQPTHFGRLWRLVEADSASVRPISLRSSYSRPATSSSSGVPTLPAVPVQTYNSSSFLTPPQPASSSKKPAPTANTKPTTDKPLWRVKKLSSANIPKDPTLLIAGKIGIVPQEHTKDFEMGVSASAVPAHTGPRKSVTFSPVPEHSSSVRVVRNGDVGSDGDDDSQCEELRLHNADRVELSASRRWVEDTLKLMLVNGYCLHGKGQVKQKERELDIKGVMESMLQTHESSKKHQEEVKQPMIVRADACVNVG
ncbi:hypothetical protein KEM56_000254 [Ascosphaera pollenicola]|nr:hypothetical protein KEM56_000254 [Ascosphaera pollenicola]